MWRYSFISSVIITLLIHIPDLYASSNELPVLSQYTVQSNATAILTQAINDDLAGVPQLARKGYDSLVNTSSASDAAVPSAINYVSLDKPDVALKAFQAIQLGGSVRDAQYARLWQARLLMQKNKGKTKPLIETLKPILTTAWGSAHEKAIAALFIGQGSVDDIYSAIMDQENQSAEQMRDAITESTFFAAGYLQFIKHDNAAANKLYQQYHLVFNRESLEAPLITREMKNLNTIQ